MSEVNIADDCKRIRLHQGDVGVSFLKGFDPELCAVGFSNITKAEIGTIIDNKTDESPIHTIVELKNLKSAKVLQKIVNTAVAYLEGDEHWEGVFYAEITEEGEEE